MPRPCPRRWRGRPPGRRGGGRWGRAWRRRGSRRAPLSRRGRRSPPGRWRPGPRAGRGRWRWSCRGATGAWTRGNPRARRGSRGAARGPFGRKREVEEGVRVSGGGWRRRAGRRRGGGADEGISGRCARRRGMARTVYMVTPMRCARPSRGRNHPPLSDSAAARVARRARRLVALGNARRGDARGATRNCRVGVVGTDEDAARSGARAALADATDIVDVRERRRHPGHRSRDVRTAVDHRRAPRSAAMWLSTSARYRIPTGKAHESSDELESAEDDDDPSRISVAGDEVRILGRRSAGLAILRAPSARAGSTVRSPCRDRPPRRSSLRRTGTRCTSAASTARRSTRTPRR